MIRTRHPSAAGGRAVIRPDRLRDMRESAYLTIPDINPDAAQS